MDSKEVTAQCTDWQLVTGLIGSSCCDLTPNQCLGIQHWKEMICFSDSVFEKVKDLWEVDVWVNWTSVFKG